jgi:hypothetical protein
MDIALKTESRLTKVGSVPQSEAEFGFDHDLNCWCGVECW